MLATISSHVAGAKYTHKWLTDDGWQVDYSTVTSTAETHYIQELYFGNKTLQLSRSISFSTEP